MPLLPVILAAFFMYGFDGNVVNVALPAIRGDLGAGQAALELVVAGYVFSYATGLVIGGRLGDILGHRRMFLTGMAAFTAASVLCGLAQSPTQLVLARLVQGLSAAAMVPQVLALITTALPAADRPRALAWFGVTGGLSGVCGQLLGGVLLDGDLFGLGWRAVFLVNLPVGLAVLAVAAAVLPRTDTGRRPALDGIGALAVSGSLALALVPLVLGREAGWPLWAWAMLAAAVPAFLAALRRERRLAARGGQPLLDPQLLRGPVFRTGLAVNAAFMAYFAGFVFVLALTLQTGFGYSPLRSGLVFTPMAVLAMAGSLTGKRLLPRYGLRVPVAGGAVTALSLLVTTLGLRTTGADHALPWLLTALALMGVGNGLVLPSLIGAPMAGITPERAGTASGTLSTTQQFAAVTGVAALGGTYFTVLDGHGYATAAAAATWLALGAVLVMIGLTVRLGRVTAAAVRNER
ncbi:MFS transporter [Streptomyces rubellomurinus]|uniref:MFS transporter n=1 Tax=Streptomyces rubellomurinus (strain ATCC 31215) TaxID=359131 RepID=A0A0F2TDG5_STRR3|nr:MFS transporter [Streptomyces rubellomurinus]KJS61209.1 MFS transporter [Streptomyces rubellomurinus]